jgi:tetratricopeptide (TPR) repeat protein
VREIVEEARRGVLDNPRSAHAWGLLGEVFLANELEEQGAACFAEAERLDPTDARWPYYQAGPLVNQGDREGALPYLRRAIDLADAGETAPRLLLGESLLLLGRPDEAEPWFRGALSGQPEDARALFDLGLLAVSRQQWTTAREHLSRCLGSPYARQKARVQLALVCRRLGQQAAADDYLAQARRVPADADWPDSFVTQFMRWAVTKRNRYRLVEQLEAAGRYAEAAAVLTPLTRQYPDDYLPHFTLGKMLGRTGDHDRAEASLRKARRLAPDKVQTHYYLSLVLFLKGEALRKRRGTEARILFEESAGLARQALGLQGDYGFAFTSLGLSLRRLGRRAEALDAFRQAARCSPELAEVHFYLGEALAEAGRLDEARSRLNHALRLAEHSAPWRRAAAERLASLPKEGAKRLAPSGP